MIDAQLSQLAREVDDRCRLRGEFLLRSGTVTDEPALFIREQAKNYGTRRLAEGGDPIVDTVVCAIDRSTPAANQLASHGIGVRAVLTKGLLDAASKAGPR
jgi:orotate phosphoribosyltransferase